MTPSSDQRSPFIRSLFANLKLSAIIIAIGLAAVALFGVIAQEPVAWEIPVFLAVGMLVSSVVNALYDARREDGGGGNG